MITSITPAQRAAYDKEGHLIIRKVFEQKRIDSLLRAIERIVDCGAKGEISISWLDQHNKIPDRLSDLFLPDKYDPAFGDWLDEQIIPIIESILQFPSRFSLFGMLAAGADKPYNQSWHRDIPDPADITSPAVFFDPEPFYFTQFNAPLRSGDQFLQIIPGSHKRKSTPEEVRAYQVNRQGEMPGQLIVELAPGDIVFYNANLWHRGWNPKGKLRWTLHAAFWRRDFPVMTHEAAWGEALRKANHLEKMPPKTRRTIESYLQAHSEAKPMSLLQALKNKGLVS